MKNVAEPSIEEEAAPLAVRSAAEVASWTPSFAVTVDEMERLVRQKQLFFSRIMKDGTHYQTLAGGTKPALSKAGAELLLSSMNLHPQLDDEQPPILDLDGTGAGNGEPLVYYRRRCRIYRQTGPQEHDRVLIAQASGSCSSREKKYRYRGSERVCPSCGKPTIVKGKEEYGGGFLCFKKKGGCGARFGDSDEAIIGQPTGLVPNPDVADLDNTILKMADKRAVVAATLFATGCSDIFTQDVEDGPEAPWEAPNAASAAPPERAKAARATTPTPSVEKPPPGPPDRRRVPEAVIKKMWLELGYAFEDFQGFVNEELGRKVDQREVEPGKVRYVWTEEESRVLYGRLKEIERRQKEFGGTHTQESMI